SLSEPQMSHELVNRHTRYFEAGFHARLSGRLAAMGYRVERDGKGFWDIAGVPETVKAKFSRRTQEIEAAAKELGIVDEQALAELGAKTREAKGEAVSLSELQAEWNERLTAPEREAIEAIHGDADGSGAPPSISATEALKHGAAHLFERRSAVSVRQLAESALRRGFGAVGVDDAWREMAKRQAEGTLLTATLDDQVMATTRRVLAEESRLINLARAGKGACMPLAPDDHRLQGDIFHDPDTDTREQEAAIRQTLSSHDRIMIVRGGAGTGKTTLLKEVLAGIEANGRQVFAFAPTAEASRGNASHSHYQQVPCSNSPTHRLPDRAAVSHLQQAATMASNRARRPEGTPA
ncbi:MAG: relaxase domain-containing protein, partial [Thermoanaerobaculia bacterium]|nr:relaxase domain-containing protein [Thermoanaerobaculia bacterium]